MKAYAQINVLVSKVPLHFLFLMHTNTALSLKSVSIVAILSNKALEHSLYLIIFVSVDIAVA